MLRFEQSDLPDPFKKAFRQLFPELYRYAMGILHVKERDEAIDAGKIVADSFLDLAKTPIDFNDIDLVKTRVQTVIGKKCIDYLIAKDEAAEFNGDPIDEARKALEEKLWLKITNSLKGLLSFIFLY